MHPRVTAILVVRSGGDPLDRTLAALRAQERPVDALVAVDASSDPSWAPLLDDGALATHRVRTRAAGIGGAVASALAVLEPARDADEWLWLLADDTAPDAAALARLLAAVEIAPSVAIAGPKLVDPADPALLRSYGESVSRLGATVPLVEDELDQAQHDRGADVLAVQTAGMLVRRAVYDALGGFDPGLPHVDAGLDLGVRARLAGHRVVRVPGARVARPRRPEDAGRRTPHSTAARRRLARAAQLHRRLVWAPALAVPLHWLSLLPLAVLRALGHLLAKRPESVAGELAAAARAAFDPTVPGARARLRRGRRLGWAAIAPLRVPPAELRERRAAARDRRAEERGQRLEIVRAGFVSGGGAALVVVAALVGVGMLWRLVGAESLTGGALRPLAETAVASWRAVLGEPADTVLGWAPADPFSALLAVLGSLTFWDPSLAIVLLWLAALPLSALGAWWLATRLSERALPPLVAGALWALAPPLLAALAEGRPGAVIAHVLLPWLAFAALEAGRSWSAAAGGALLFAGTVVAAPSLAPALLVLAVLAALVRPRSALRLLGIPVLGLVILAPLALVQAARGTPLGILADPGVPVPSAEQSGVGLLLGRPAPGLDGWSELVALLGLPDSLPGPDALADVLPLAVLLPVLLALPLALLALASAFLPGSRRAIAALLAALLGLATAVAAAHLVVASGGSAAVTPWPGAGLSLFLLGLVAAAVLALEALRPAAAVAGLVTVAAALVASAPAVGLLALDDGAAVQAGGEVLPALVAAEAAGDPGIGTLVLEAQDDGSIAARLERGAGTSLEAVSTLDATLVGAPAAELPPERLLLAELAGNLASVGGFEAGPALEELGVSYLLVPPARGDAAAVAQRTTEALDANPAVEAIGATAAGLLWRTDVPRAEAAEAPRLGGPALGVLAVQGAILLVTLLLAIPTGPRRRVVDPASLPGEDPADTFAEDDNA